MRNGFSLIELILAFAILVSAIVAAAQVAYGLPRILQNAYLEAEASRAAKALLDRAIILGRNDFNAPTSSGTSTKDGIDSSSWIESLDDSAEYAISTSHWHDLEGMLQSVSFRTLITNYTDNSNHPCQPFVSGDWAHPRILHSYRIAPGDLLPTVIPNGQYQVSSLAIQGSQLAVGIGTTAHATDPTLFFFRVTDPDQAPEFLQSFDNTPLSTIGFTALAAGDDNVYAANGFENTAMANCAYSVLHCRQLQVFSVQGNSPIRAASYQVPTTSPTLAITSSGAIAAGTAVAYKAGLVYLGLAKTAGGQEFQIIDIRNLDVPKRVGGVSVGRSINSILISSTTAYIATDANNTGGKAIIAEDVRDPERPAELFSHAFPGAGYVHALATIKKYLYSGRSYANGTSEEFTVLDKNNALTRTGGIDLGTSAAHRSVKAIIARDFLTFILTDDRLQAWNMQDAAHPTLYGSLLLPHGAATAMACRLNTFYIGSVDTDGNGYVTVITSS